MRTCIKCEYNGPLSDFTRNLKAKDKVGNVCKECTRAKSRKRYARDGEKMREANRVSYHKYHDKNLARGAQYRSENSDKRRIAHKAYYEENRKKVLTRIAQYKAENPHIAKTSKAKRRAIESSLPNEITSDDVRDIFDRFDGLCAISGEQAEHLDHFIPLATGVGGNVVGNLVPLSAKLNLSKQAKNPFIWAESFTEEEQVSFSEVVAYLADLNDLSIEEYEAHVYNCFD